jgi:hypothetical protein
MVDVRYKATRSDTGRCQQLVTKRRPDGATIDSSPVESLNQLLPKGLTEVDDGSVEVNTEKGVRAFPIHFGHCLGPILSVTDHRTEKRRQ